MRSEDLKVGMITYSEMWNQFYEIIKLEKKLLYIKEYTYHIDNEKSTRDFHIVNFRIPKERWDSPGNTYYDNKLSNWDELHKWFITICFKKKISKLIEYSLDDEDTGVKKRR
jgi:hypothetical protein